ncbi:hypothetical protein DK37_15070 [Halomonas sp. SUBG004]|nr:hypothetical protein DK37_15070 [Halomonas sp. SUBG004]
MSLFLSPSDLVSSFGRGFFPTRPVAALVFILPSLFIALGGSDVAIVASLCAAVFSAMSALPRGLINNSAAALSKMVMVRDYARSVVVPLRKKNLYLGGCFGACVIADDHRVFFIFSGAVNDVGAGAVFSWRRFAF